MVAVPYGLSAYERDRGNFPNIPLINMFAESFPTEETPVLQSRHGLGNSGTALGAGPIKALYKTDGVLNNTLFALSGNQLYANGVSVGTVVGTGPAKITGYETTVFANAGGLVYSYDGTTFATVTTPDSFETLDMCVGASRLIVLKKNTGRLYWSNVLSSTINALSFATAENSPDNLKACLYVGDVLVLFGSETVEQWPITGSATTPFQPLIGRVFPVGIRDVGCATAFANTFAWITNRGQIAIGNPDKVVSTPDLDSKILASTTASLWTFLIEGVEFLAVRLDNETFVFSSTTKTWSEFQSYGQTNWLPRCYFAGFFGSATDGRLFQWTADHSDFGGVMERRLIAGTMIDSPVLPLSNVVLDTNPGRTPFLTGDYLNPKVGLRTSKDGFIWTDWNEVNLGVNGNYRPRIQWRSLGYFRQPGLFMEFRVTDPVPFRVSGVLINEPYGGV